MSSLIRAASLKNYFEVAEQLELNPQPLLRAVGLSRAMLADPERRIPAVAAVRLLEDSAHASACAARVSINQLGKNQSVLSSSACHGRMAARQSWRTPCIWHFPSIPCSPPR